MPCYTPSDRICDGLHGIQLSITRTERPTVVRVLKRGCKYCCHPFNGSAWRVLTGACKANKARLVAPFHGTVLWTATRFVMTEYSGICFEIS